jgi:DNA-directed RNA polymerase specialized sigma24 family protein
MNLLDPVERQITMLRYIEELGYREIAMAAIDNDSRP